MPDKYKAKIVVRDNQIYVENEVDQYDIEQEPKGEVKWSVDESLKDATVTLYFEGRTFESESGCRMTPITVDLRYDDPPYKDSYEANLCRKLNPGSQVPYRVYIDEDPEGSGLPLPEAKSRQDGGRPKIIVSNSPISTGEITPVRDGDTGS